MTKIIINTPSTDFADIEINSFFILQNELYIKLEPESISVMYDESESFNCLCLSSGTHTELADSMRVQPVESITVN